jgi:hypothetical protein
VQGVWVLRGFGSGFAGKPDIWAWLRGVENELELWDLRAGEGALLCKKAG